MSAAPSDVSASGGFIFTTVRIATSQKAPPFQAITKTEQKFNYCLF
jgi:hypothetical protein